MSRAMTSSLLKIGTRGSPLALAQAKMVRDQLAAAHPEISAPEAVEILVIKTTGDRVQDRALSEIGGKGLFTKEIEEALLEGRIDLAVHSMKDMPTVLPEGLEIPTILEREDPRDAFFARDGAGSLAELPQGTLVGTASLRRQAQVLLARPDLKVATLRGNVDTRLRKLRDGEVDATLLAVAGLKRLGREVPCTLSTEEMLPAVAQGAVGVELRSGDERTRAFLDPLSHRATFEEVAAERACLAVLDGSCRTPIAALAEPLGAGELRLRALVALPDGSECHRTEVTGSRGGAEALGREAGERLKAAGGLSFFEKMGG
jgi:hydroxymethylbilane synthase